MWRRRDDMAAGCGERADSAVAEGARRDSFRYGNIAGWEEVSNRGEDRSVRIWEMEGGKMVAKLEGHQKWVVSVGWNTGLWLTTRVLNGPGLQRLAWNFSALFLKTSGAYTDSVKAPN